MIKRLAVIVISLLCFNKMLYADFYQYAMTVKQAEIKKKRTSKQLEEKKEQHDLDAYLINHHADKSILALNKDWAVIVFFSSSCPHCKVFVPVVSQLIKDYGFQSQAYTLDGKPLEDFQHPIMANPKLIEAFFGDEPIRYPAVFLVNVNTLDGIPISVGELTYDELLARFQQIASILKDSKNNQRSEHV